MSYVKLLHDCPFPRGATHDNPGVGSLWKCDDCCALLELVRIEWKAGQEAADLTWLRRP